MEKNTRINKCKKLRDKLVKFATDLKETNFYQLEFISILKKSLTILSDRKIEKIVCYGLGSFCDGVDTTSRYQLALLLLIFEYLDVEDYLSPVIDIYDPSFSQLDKDTLSSFTRPQFNLIEENEYCAREISTSAPTRCALIYMPHLDKFLYNNLLGANWTKENLYKLVILGNSFQEMIDNETKHIRKNQLHYMDQLVINKGALMELTIDDRPFKHWDIFNSLSFHLISEDWILKNSTKIQQCRIINWTKALC